MYVTAHGGAGSPPEEPADRQRALADAVASAATADTPLAAVCLAVRPLELDPDFNAGVGGAVQSDGVVRTEAGVMADEGTAGAAAGLTGVAHATDVARLVATETPHLLVAGDPARELAAAHGVDTGVTLLTDATDGRIEAADPPPLASDAHLDWVREHFSGTDTVGAVATDGDRLAAATSTAGRWFALAGRVGDVPQLGAGFFADDRGGASATGEGEAIARFGLARRAVELLDTFSPREAANEAIAEFKRETGGRAGVLVLDHEGRVGREHNTAAMQTARTDD
ncbi:isoaspartyl peptidase/L-asparaginase [Haloarcula salinisoli]|uniref:Plant-type L-asparaginase n=1 Tax=Haloarcula salinisoli TaxID=2487746 RepID=A0A8J7YPD3_9EURY|nr:isoaspartyl peptidase/L-asparaginase [Halomicroarcula salinisoli]MBX0304853.1 isoaspartyl peptidase/L-asparaginase [Halomicroarcula salinisoli]